jgi:uncharacterized protein YifN (PemK superfamily)
MLEIFAAGCGHRVREHIALLLEPVDAGTIVHFDFDELGGHYPEIRGAHPAVVVTPRERQAGGLIVVVPLTSSLANYNNPTAVEVFHRAFNSVSPTGRTFALCGLAISIARERPSLDYYVEGRDQTRNRRPKYRLSGRDLEAVRLKVSEQHWPRRQFARMLVPEKLAAFRELSHRAMSSLRFGRNGRHIVQPTEGE